MSKDENITSNISPESLHKSTVYTSYIVGKPKVVGAWVIGETLHIYVTHRVTDEQIENTKNMFGWEWVDYE